MRGLIPNTGGFLAISNEPRKNNVFINTFTPGMSFNVDGGLYEGLTNRINWKYVVVATIGPLSIGAFAPDQFSRVDWVSNARMEQLKEVTKFDNSLLKFYVSSVDWKAVSIQDQDIVTTTKQLSASTADVKPNVSLITGIREDTGVSFFYKSMLHKLNAEKKVSLEEWIDYLTQYFKIGEIDQIIANKIARNNSAEKNTDKAEDTEDTVSTKNTDDTEDTDVNPENNDMLSDKTKAEDVLTGIKHAINQGKKNIDHTIKGVKRTIKPPDYEKIKRSWDLYAYYLLNDLKDPENTIKAGSEALSEFLHEIKDLEVFDKYIPRLKKKGRNALYWPGYFYPNALTVEHKNEVYNVANNNKFLDVFPSFSSKSPNMISMAESELLNVMTMGAAIKSTIYTGLGSTGAFNYTPTYSFYPNKTNYVIDDTPQPTFKNGPTYTWGGITNYFDVNYRLMPGISKAQEMSRFVAPTYSVVAGLDKAIYITRTEIIMTGMKFAENLISIIINAILSPKEAIVNSISTTIATVLMISAIFENTANTDQTVGTGTYMDGTYKLIPHENVSNETFYRQKRYGFKDEKLGENARFYYYNIPVNKMYSEVSYLDDSGSFNSNKTQLNKDIWSMVHFKGFVPDQPVQDVSTYVNPHFIYGKFNIQMKYEKYFWLLLNKQNRGNA